MEKIYINTKEYYSIKNWEKENANPCEYNHIFDYLDKEETVEMIIENEYEFTLIRLDEITIDFYFIDYFSHQEFFSTFELVDNKKPELVDHMCQIGNYVHLPFTSETIDHQYEISYDAMSFINAFIRKYSNI